MELWPTFDSYRPDCSDAIAAVHRRTHRSGGDTRLYGNFLGTLIPYASAAFTQTLALILEHELVPAIPLLRGTHHDAATLAAADLAAIHLAAIAASALGREARPLGRGARQPAKA
ncbi:MAG TPA: hypothetical protein VM261_00920 [Kofleriaceae bacterium]|nr:hypothetical protein [Kofleriaceae bacterium]